MKVGDLVKWRGRRIGIILQEYWTYYDEESQFEVLYCNEPQNRMKNETWYEYDLEVL